jgi:hypothetical protein
MHSSDFTDGAPRRSSRKRKKTNGSGTDEVLASIASSAGLWFATCGKILTKDQRLVTPDPNGYQLRILEVYEWCVANGTPCRILALKPRQKGSSTVSAALVYHHCRRFRSRAVQIADRYKNSDNLFAMTCRYGEYDDFPWPQQWEATATAAIMTCGAELWSRIERDTAENPRAGRSGTLQVLHVSEAAHFPNDGEKCADKTMLSLLNSLADVPESVAIVETTANGAAGWFYEHWLGATTLEEMLAGNLGNGWVKVFAPWFVFEDSRIAVPEFLNAGLPTAGSGWTEREQRGATLYHWNAVQIAWRRWTLAQKCAGREDLFDQEYPEDDKVAFLASGRPRFSMTGMTRLRTMENTLQTRFGFLRESDGHEGMVFEPHASGWAQIWEDPREGCRYLLWCDTATGREQTRDSHDPDRHSILVLRQGFAEPTGECGNAMLVARVRPPCFDDWHVLEEKVIALCQYYGRCLIGVEVPMGLTLLEGLRRAGMPLFKRRATGSGGVAGPATPLEKLGFQSNTATKPLVVGSLSRAIDGDPPLDIYDSHVIDELGSFVVHDDGREAALPGKHDDDVMALAMAAHHLPLATLYRHPKPPRAAPPADLHRWKPLHR